MSIQRICTGHGFRLSRHCLWRAWLENPYSGVGSLSSLARPCPPDLTSPYLPASFTATAPSSTTPSSQDVECPKCSLSFLILHLLFFYHSPPPWWPEKLLLILQDSIQWVDFVVPSLTSLGLYFPKVLLLTDYITYPITSCLWRAIWQLARELGVLVPQLFLSPLALRVAVQGRLSAYLWNEWVKLQGRQFIFRTFQLPTGVPSPPFLAPPPQP